MSETTPSEDTLVQMLLEAGGGIVADHRHLMLARAAARWAVGHGWKLHLQNSYFYEVQTLTYWILVRSFDQMLEIRVRLAEPGAGWCTHAQHRIAHLGHALDVLAAEELLPERFSPIGYRALADYAESMDRGASQIAAMATAPGAADEGEHFAWEMQIRAAVMNRAADQARAFPRSELAVP